jgi:hypothetical protein
MSHYTPPLHRRILPWLFFLIFLAVAPALLLYTAGYRYNPKKNQLERNGTLIIDSTPSGAIVFIDGENTGETSPVTIQNVVPGWHKIGLQKPGFHPWEKTIEIRPEQVSFANDIWLWRESAPHLVLKGNFERASANPLQDTLALIERSTSTARLLYWSPDQSSSSVHTIPASIQQFSPLRWNARGDAVLGGGLSSNTETWWSKSDTRSSVDRLPNAIYHWLDQEAIGSDGHTQFILDTRTGRFMQTPFLPPTISTSNNLSLKTDATSSGQLLVERSIRTRALALPKGNWNFGDVRPPYILLNDKNNWLAVNPRIDQPYRGEVEGDYPRWFQEARNPAALFLNFRELWLWTMGGTPQFLWRQSEPLVQTTWHRSGHYLFLADETHLSALSLNDRYGRTVTSLASFDQIFDIGILNRDIYIAGTKDGERGLWKLSVE